MNDLTKNPLTFSFVLALLTKILKAVLIPNRHLFLSNLTNSTAAFHLYKIPDCLARNLIFNDYDRDH